MSITLCMIVKNEEKYIGMCLEHAMQLADDAIIVDTGSTDTTIALIEAFKANISVYHHTWNKDFSEARNVSIEHATGDLILSLDADEKLICDKEKLMNFIENNEEYDAYTIPFYNILSADKVVYSDVYIKLFRNKGYRYTGAIHEQISIDKNKLKAIPSEICRIYHYGYLEDSKTQDQKIKRNFEISLNEVNKNPNSAFAHYNIGLAYVSKQKYNKALDHFIKCYELDKGQIKMYTFYMLKLMAQCLNELKRYRECINFVRQIVEDNHINKFPDLFCIMGEAYYMLKDYSNAIKSFQEAIVVGETKEFVSLKGMGSFIPKLRVAHIYSELKKTDEAIKWFVEAIFDPNNFNKMGLDEFKQYLKEHKCNEILNELNNLT